MSDERSHLSVTRREIKADNPTSLSVRRDLPSYSNGEDVHKTSDLDPKSLSARPLNLPPRTSAAPDDGESRKTL